jgi:malate dehydrogenase
MSVISARDLDGATGVLTIGLRDVITPLAADRAKELGIRIERAEKSPQPLPAQKSFTSVPPAMRPTPAAAPAQPKSAAPAPPQQALSGALYRRGGPTPPGLRPDGEGASNAADSRPSAAR